MEGKLTANKNMEIRKLLGDDESGFLQFPTVKAKEVVPLAPETKVKILSLTSDLIVPTTDNSILLDGQVRISRDTIIEKDNTLFVDELEKTSRLTDAPTINSKTKIEGDVIVATNKTLSVDAIKPTLATDVSLDCGVNVEGNVWINPNNTVVTDRITPNPDLIAPMIVTVEGQMNVEGDMDLGSHDLAAEIV